jgi:hypothetical protein
MFAEYILNVYLHQQTNKQKPIMEAKSNKAQEKKRSSKHGIY